MSGGLFEMDALLLTTTNVGRPVGAVYWRGPGRTATAPDR
eukprot:CAMPEP_0174903670 /NCGR_PEP_ID=MMETSP0167-20121228/44943_1 /TAXON_ID=38298 /ORGANISM="Rhodella maculata, Strain CCMP736" /LENGTH=39 /DNA_ID= /DNA_START= /DNA_END= /DNA_ORIENTATION=